MTTMKENYKHDGPWDSGFLKVGSIHQIHYEQYGKKDGKPVIFLHGGPGGQTNITSTIFFNPSVYRVVLFDQRGAGKSLPAADIRENTTQHLVADIESLRSHLSIAKWHMVFGGSWGSTLALAYSQAHPDAVGSLVVRGIFTVRRAEVEFTRLAHGAAMLFPENYEEFLGALRPEERRDVYAGYHRLLNSDDPKTRLEAARAFSKWELSISQLVPPPDVYTKLNDDTWTLQHSRIECHYESNGAFMEEGQLLKPENIAKIKHIPCSIIQGRYDIVCPPKTAWELHKALPDSKLYMIPDAGHSAMEPGTRSKLIEVCDEYASLP